MVKIGCPAVTTLQFQGLKEMDMASAVVLSSLPLTKKKQNSSPEFFTEGSSHSFRGGVCYCTEISPIKSNSGHREI